MVFKILFLTILAFLVIVVGVMAVLPLYLASDIMFKQIQKAKLEEAKKQGTEKNVSAE